MRELVAKGDLAVFIQAGHRGIGGVPGEEGERPSYQSLLARKAA
jgi:hypothetical protein